MPLSDADRRLILDVAKEAIRLRANGKGHGWAALSTEKAMHERMTAEVVVGLLEELDEARDLLEGALAAMNFWHASDGKFSHMIAGVTAFLSPADPGAGGGT